MEGGWNVSGRVAGKYGREGEVWERGAVGGAKGGAGRGPPGGRAGLGAQGW